MKKCNKCGKLLDETMFHKNSASKDGLTNTCKECKAAYDENYKSVVENKERQKKYNSEYFSKPENKQKAKDYNNRPDIKEKKQIYNKEYHSDAEHMKRANILLNKKYETNIYYKLNMIMISSFSALLSGRTNNSQVIIQRCGYTAQQLRQHIESQFTPEMNWSNYGSYWELDHIIPRFKFYYESFDDEQFKQCWALSNLRPLTVKENRSRAKV